MMSMRANQSGFRFDDLKARFGLYVRIFRAGARYKRPIIDCDFRFDEI